MARSVVLVAVDRSWRSPDRRWLVDEIVDEPGVRFRIWDSEGAPVGDAVGQAELRQVLDRLGVDPDVLQQVPVTDPWCE
jgi:hypothetical protein